MLMLSYCCSFFEFVFYPHGIRFRGLWSIIMTCHSVSDDELFPSKLGWRCAYDTSIISTLVGIVELGSLKGDPPLSTEVYFYLIDTTFFPISSTSSLGHHHLFRSVLFTEQNNCMGIGSPTHPFVLKNSLLLYLLPHIPTFYHKSIIASATLFIYYFLLHKIAKCIPQ